MIINCLTVHSIIMSSSMMAIFFMFSADEDFDWLKRANTTNLLGAICGKIEP